MWSPELLWIFLRREKNILLLLRIEPQIMQTCRLVTIPTMLSSVNKSILGKMNILVNILLMIDPFFFTTAVLCNGICVGRLSSLTN
jgi:hypothetical protein